MLRVNISIKLEKRKERKYIMGSGCGVSRSGTWAKVGTPVRIPLEKFQAGDGGRSEQVSSSVGGER